MAAESIYTRKANEVTAPVAGQITVIAGALAAGSLDLATTGPTAINMQNADKQPVGDGSGTVTIAGGVDRYVEFYADGVDIGLVFGATAAAVTGANAPVLAQTGTNAAGACMRIPAGIGRSLFIHPATRYVGYVASAATGFLRISVASR